MSKNALKLDDAEKLSVPELMERLSSSEQGLSESEARKRLEEYGYNEITEKATSPLFKLLGYFWGPIPWMIERDYLSVDQSGLTGESLPVRKKKGDIVYSGSVDEQGEMVALVISTGMETYFGRTAKLVESAGAVSHFQKAVLHIGNYLIYLNLVLASILVIAQVVRQDYKELHYMPFDPVGKRTEATINDTHVRTFKVAKGAPQVILDLARVSEDVKKRAEQFVSDFAAKGYRTLGVAWAD
jgi:magnesium-transporting ATPase (P-type)